MRIVFLMMADENKTVDIKSLNALRKKYPANRSSGIFSKKVWPEWITKTNNLVTEFDLIPLYQEKVTGHLSNRFLDKMMKVSQACVGADKVMLGIHGIPYDTDCGHIDGFNSIILVHYMQLAHFILLFLPPRTKDYKLVLIMCYGARSHDPHIDHQGYLSAEHVKSSFAYKFFKELCQRRNIVLTARTGAVSFSADGRSLVETEAVVEASLGVQALQPEDERIHAMYTALLKRFSAQGKVARDEYDLQEERIREKMMEGRTDWNDTELIIKDIINHRDLIKPLQEAADGKSIGKYGKFVYRYDRARGTATVTRKYPKPAVLYSGAL